MQTISSNFCEKQYHICGTVVDSPRDEYYYSPESGLSVNSENAPLAFVNHVPFLSEFLETERVKDALLLELEEIEESKDEFLEDGILINSASLEDAIYFATSFKKELSVKSPVVEFNPNGDIAFTWRRRYKGILNMAFIGGGLLTWAAYLEYPEEQSLNDRFEIKNGLPSLVTKILNIIAD